MVTSRLTWLVPSCESILLYVKSVCITDIVWNLLCRLQQVTPIQIAERVIEIIGDMEKQTPKLKAIVQHNKEEVLKVSAYQELKMQQGNREFFNYFFKLCPELAQGKSCNDTSFKLLNEFFFRWHLYPLDGMLKESPCLLWMVFLLLWRKSLTW